MRSQTTHYTNPRAYTFSHTVTNSDTRNTDSGNKVFKALTSAHILQSYFCDDCFVLLNLIKQLFKPTVYVKASLGN